MSTGCVPGRWRASRRGRGRRRGPKNPARVRAGEVTWTLLPALTRQAVVAWLAVLAARRLTAMTGRALPGKVTGTPGGASERAG